jgi:predicted nuclease with TOPRIM domain
MGEGLGAFALSKLTGAPAITGTDILGAEAIGKKAATLEEVFKNISKQFNELANEQDKYATRTQNFNAETSNAFDEFSANLRKENNLLLEAIKLRKEFGKDLWDKAMNMKRSLKSIEDLYWWYKKQCKEATTKSEIDIQLKRSNTKGLEYLYT